MMDKSHCFMNVDDEHEYEQFYDFSNTYEGHPDAASSSREEGKERMPLLTKKSTAKKDEEIEEEGADGWEDVDVEDAASAEEVESSEDEDKKPNIEDSSKTESAFSIITDSQDRSGAGTQPFQNITDGPSKEGDQHLDDGLSSIKGGETLDGRNKKKGMTREEAMLGLKIKPAQLLETGEVLLGNGKIIGSRALKYLYKQRYRFPDSRESVVVNKIALEYRKIKAITNGNVSEEEFGRGRIS